MAEAAPLRGRLRSGSLRSPPLRRPRRGDGRGEEEQFTEPRLHRPSKPLGSQAVGTRKPPQCAHNATPKPGTSRQAFGGPFVNAENRSIGIGRKVVVLCSLEISRMV